VTRKRTIPLARTITPFLLDCFTCGSIVLVDLKNPVFGTSRHRKSQRQGFMSTPFMTSVKKAALCGGSLFFLQFAASAQLQSVVNENTTFALNLYSQLATNPGNLFFSPYSISTCLGMTYEGAAGETEAQMGQVLGVGTNQPQVAAQFGELQSELNTNQQPGVLQLNIANALWLDQGYPFVPAFLATASNQFQANLNQINFATESAQATQDINNWVAQETKNKIQNILQQGDITPATLIVLANAIYFLGNWTESFATSNTTVQPFYPSSDTVVQAPLMHQLPPSSYTTNDILFNYMAATNFQALELPYASNQSSMVIVLPSQVDGLAQVEQQLSTAFVSNVLAQMVPTPVEVYLPKFTLNCHFDLAGTLSEMGMPDAFEPGVADFSAMAPPGIFLSKVVHQAWIQTDESGTEAAAATVVIGVGAVVSPQWPPLFRADHPFLFFIRDNTSGTILFLGRVTNPTASTSSAQPSLLTFAHSPSGMRLQWPQWVPSLRLQQCTDLQAGNWTDSVGVSSDGTNNFLKLTAPAASSFYRLTQYSNE
jgi:serine protease inhibitor